jgi:DNA repair protein RadC
LKLEAKIMSENTSIKNWAEDDKPREKLMTKGRLALSDAELLAILINTGNTTDSAVDIAKKLLATVGNDLYKLSKLNVKELSQVRGIGPAKAVTIIAALELGLRKKNNTKEEVQNIRTSKDAYQHLLPYLSDLQHEEMWVILLNSKLKIISTQLISKGGVNETAFNSKVVFKMAVQHLASSIVLAHNHPSGNVQPSDEDTQLTKKIKLAGEILDIQLNDHLIISQNDYYSFGDEGNL